MHANKTKSILSAAVATFVCLLLSGSALASALEHAIVFHDGERYDTFRIPALIQAPNGDLLAFAEGRSGSGDTGNIDLVMKRSIDGGAHWGDVKVVYNWGSNTIGNPAPIVDEETGDIFLFSTVNYGEDTQAEIQAGTSRGTRYPYLFKSDDSGYSWSDPIPLGAVLKPAGTRWFATGPGHGIQLTRGSNSGRLLACAAFNKGDNDPTGGAIVFYSDDHGSTWQRGATLQNDGTTDYFPSESMAVELLSGEVYVNSRNRGRGRASSFLADGGETFEFGYQDDIVDPGVQGSVARVTVTGPPHYRGRLVLANPADDDVRRKLSLRVSDTEGYFWEEPKMVTRWPSGYSDLVELSSATAQDPELGMLYENGLNGYHDRITFTRFDLSWLLSPQIMQIDFSHLQPYTSFTQYTGMLDTQGNRINGTFRGDSSTIPGSSRYSHITPSAVWFDGYEDVIIVSDSDHHAFDFDHDDSFTLEAVFGTSNHTSGGANGSGPLIAKDVGPNTPSYWLRIQDGKLRFFIDDGSHSSSVTSSVGVTDNIWHHAAAVRDAGTKELRLYVDYKLVGRATDTTTGSFANDNDFLIGSFNASSPNKKRYRGYINLVRVSMKALALGTFL